MFLLYSSAVLCKQTNIVLLNKQSGVPQLIFYLHRKMTSMDFQPEVLLYLL